MNCTYYDDATGFCVHPEAIPNISCWVQHNTSSPGSGGSTSRSSGCRQRRARSSAVFRRTSTLTPAELRRTLRESPLERMLAAQIEAVPDCRALPAAKVGMTALEARDVWDGLHGRADVRAAIAAEGGDG